jgi:hypothetical protein
MAIRITEQSRTAHARLVRALADQYESQGYYVQADHIGHRNGSPPPINGHIPDVAGYASGTLQVIAEAETCDTISDSDTSNQWTAFARSPYRFEVIVPKSCLQDAQMQASLWGVTVDKWWWLDI